MLPVVWGCPGDAEGPLSAGRIFGAGSGLALVQHQPGALCQVGDLPGKS